MRRTRRLLQGDIPSPVNPPSGCVFRTRCPYAQEICRQVTPEPTALGPGHEVRCHFPLVPRAAAA